jgi:folate-binding protein YgfZ
MHDKPQALSGLEFALPSHHVVTLTGRDAAAFAQAQFMNDVGALTPGHWQWSGWLTPKGRVIALFALLRLGEEALWLVLPDADPAAFADALRRFVFRSKLTIAVREDLFAGGGFSVPAGATGDLLAGDADAGVELDMSGAGGARQLRIAARAFDVDPDAEGRWTQFDLQHGLPRLPPSQADQWTPQQLSLERLRAFSVKKGCYPGQEIVARTHFLGKAKRALMRLQGAGVDSMDEVMIGEPSPNHTGLAHPAGQVICAAGDEGLAVMPLQAPAGPLFTGGKPCVQLPLTGGLER